MEATLGELRAVIDAAIANIAKDLDRIIARPDLASEAAMGKFLEAVDWASGVVEAVAEE